MNSPTTYTFVPYHQVAIIFFNWIESNLIMNNVHHTQFIDYDLTCARFRRVFKSCDDHH